MSLLRSLMRAIALGFQNRPRWLLVATGGVFCHLQQSYYRHFCLHCQPYSVIFVDRTSDVIYVTIRLYVGYYGQNSDVWLEAGMTIREYEKSHQWLTFSGDAMQKAKPELWMTLGECQSKCEHLSKYPLRPDVAENIHRMYMAKGVLATTAMEGNTLSEAEVRKLLDGELELPPSREYLAREVQNIVDECNRILMRASSGQEVALSTDRIKEINKTVLAGLQLEEHVQPGVIRTYEVGVGLYKAAPPDECEFLLDKMCQWLADPKYFGGDDDPRSMVFGIIKAILAHLYLAWIHPFGDGNGRTARLIEFQILIAARVPSPAAHLLSNHYYRTRSDYYKQLHFASVGGGDVLPFITYAVRGFLDGLREQIEEVKKQVIDVVWSKVSE